MIQNVAHDLGGSPLFGIISVCLFFIVFAGALMFAAAQRRSHLDEMSALPLEDADRVKGDSHEQ